ncbi:MAG: peptidase C11, partial [Lachnospiraceae bacterium]|nr:peptidase C11 [Lachnospiraceae bacterium]
SQRDYNYDFGGGVPQRAGGSSLIKTLIAVQAALLLGGGGAATGLFGNLFGSGDTAITEAPQYSGDVHGSGSYSGGADAGDAVLDQTVAQGAREKRTKILGNKQDVFTIMVYLCGTDLESKSAMATNDLNEMLQAEIGEKINLIIYTGGCKNWRNTTISSNNNQIYQIRDGELTCLEQNMGTAAMTNPDTLSSFIQYCTEKFPANRNALIFWDHGGGSVAGYGYDEKYPRNGGMTLAGIKKALTDGGITFDFIGFDTCLMATVENALMLDDYADYMIASEETEPGIGWYYTNWLTELNRNTSMETTQIGKNIIDEFTRACAVSCRGQKTTLSIVDLAELKATVPEKLSAFSKSISALIKEKEYETVSKARNGTREFAQNSRIDQVDLAHLALNMGTPEGKELAEALEGAVKYNRTSSNVTNAYGVSIYFPYQRASNVDSAVNTYSQIGMDADYASCIREFAALQTSGQIASGGTGSPSFSLLGNFMGGTSTGGGDMINSLLNSFLGGGFDMIGGLTGRNTEFMEARSVLSEDELTSYLEDALFDASYLEWQEEDGAFKIVMPDEEWDKIYDVALNMFYDDGHGYIDLGVDNVTEYDDAGNLMAPMDNTWLSLDRHPVAYYYLDTWEEGDDYTITGRVPVLLNGDRADLVLVFDNETPEGYVAGYTYSYADGETDTVAKTAESLTEGDEIYFLCDYYNYDGTFEDSFYLGDPVVYDGEFEIANTVVGDGNVVLSYRFTDQFNKEYWSETLLIGEGY